MTTPTQNSRQVVEAFWSAWQTNDFQDDYVLEWSQSIVRIRGRANFVAINKRYSMYGWHEQWMRDYFFGNPRWKDYSSGRIFAPPIRAAQLARGVNGENINSVF